jgi:Tetratricopeptide repeat
LVDARGLAGTVGGIGLVLSTTGKTSEAEVEYRTALAIQQKLAEENPAVTLLRSELAQSQDNLAVVLRQKGKPLEAAAEYRCLGDTFLRLGQVRCDMKDLAGAAGAWKRACAEFNRIKFLEPKWAVVLGSCHAALAGPVGRAGSGVSAAEGAEQAEKARAMLRRAAFLGYRSPDPYRTESAFDPLRERPDFKLLMMEPAMPAPPFAAAR